MTRHMSHLDKEINLQNDKTEKKKVKRDEEIHKATYENADLIKKVSDLRDEKQKLLGELKNAQKIVDSLKRQTNQIRNSTLFANSGDSSQKNAINLSKKSSMKVISQVPSNARNQNTHSQYQGSGGQIQQNPGLIRSSSQPIKKGRIAKGLNYDS